jgi:hypothetical protein
MMIGRPVTGAAFFIAHPAVRAPVLFSGTARVLQIRYKNPA